MSQIIKYIVLLLFFSLSINLVGQSYIGKEKDIQKILENTANFSKYYMNGEADKIAASYTSDGKIFPNKGQIVEGTKDLESWWTMPETVKVLRHKVTPSEIRIEKNYAYDYGFYEGETQGSNGETRPFKGKYVIVWKKVGKDWKIYLDIWNSVDD